MMQARKLREIGFWFWSIGLVLIATDFLTLPFFFWKASASYIFFGLAGFFVLWAEKKEFSTRITLYRIHDILIFGPWKYLFLYFMWVTIFFPFTAQPLTSLVYVANGWISLFFVGIMAQFVFCERNMNGVSLLVPVFRKAFILYAITLCILFLNLLFHLFLPTSPLPMLSVEQMNLFLYFSIGFPFLLWDFFVRRKLLPRWLSWLTLLLGVSTTILIGRFLFQISIAASVAALILFYLYKRNNWRRIFFLFLGASIFVSIFAILLFYFLRIYPAWERELSFVREQLELKMISTFIASWKILIDSKGLGVGMGISSLRGMWRVLAEGGLFGFILYLSFFLSLLKDLYQVRRSPNIVVSNIALISVAIFLCFVGHYVENPYGAYVWVWYSIWVAFSATSKKKNA